MVEDTSPTRAEPTGSAVSGTAEPAQPVTDAAAQVQFQALLAQNLEARGLSGGDMGRVADAIGSLWEHRDDLLDAVDWLRDHRDDVMALISKLPELVASAGDGIAKAGGSAVAAAKFLVGGEADDEFSAVDLAHAAADALDRCREELADAHELIRRLGDEVDDITVPSVRPRYVKVAGLSVIAGLDIGESSLTDDAAAKIRGGADRLVGISDGLETVSEQLRRLGGAVTDAGTHLQAVGGFLEVSGGQLSGMTVSLFAATDTGTVAEAGASRPAAGGGAAGSGRLRSDASSVPSIGLGLSANPGTAKAPAKKAPAKRTPATKTSAAKTSATKAPAKKTSAKRAPAKKTPAKKAPAKNTPSKKAPAKKGPARKSAPKNAT
jgi:hypothetical protein